MKKSPNNLNNTFLKSATLQYLMDLEKDIKKNI